MEAKGVRVEAREPTEAELKEFWEWCGFKLLHEPFTPIFTAMLQYPDGTKKQWTGWLPIDLNNLFRWAVPKSTMDTLWIINNLDSPTPKIEYCFGYTRGEDNDLICWSKILPPEN